MIVNGITGGSTLTKRVRPLGLALLGVLLAVAMLTPAWASANDLTVFSCHDPAGNAVGHDGWSMARTSDPFMTIADTCGGGGHGSLLMELGSSSSGYPNGAAVEWLFSSPSWGKIASYDVHVLNSFGSFDPGSSPGSGQAFIIGSDESDPGYDYRNLGGGTLGASEISRTPPNPISTLTTNASCDGASGPCRSFAPVSRLNISATRIVLVDPTTPLASNLSGGLVSGSSQRGESEVSFTATDGGPGIYAAYLQIDGQFQPASVLDTNGGECVNLGQTTDATRSFSHVEPCKSVVSTSLPFNTATLADGAHKIKLIVEDASGNTGVGWSGTLLTQNAPAAGSAPSIIVPGSLSTGTTLSSNPGAWSAPAGAGSITFAYEWQRCDSSGSSCANIPGAQSATYTLAPSDVGHTLRLLVDGSDNDGSATAQSAPTGAVLAQNETLGAPPGSGGSGEHGSPGPAGGSGAGIAGSAGASGAPGLSGAPGTSGANGLNGANGNPASEAAVIHLGVPTSVTTPYAKRRLKVLGRLTDSREAPIGGSTLDILQQPAGSTVVTVVAHVVTSASGNFSVQVAPGASRTLTVAYRAFASDAAYAATAKIRQSVRAGVRLWVTPRRINSTQKIVLRGQVQGPIPRKGVIFELLVRYRGRPTTFHSRRTKRNGKFKVEYRFQGSIGRFPFWVEIPGGQTGFPYATGDSNKVDVTSR
jgi:hypothetical protein